MTVKTSFTHGTAGPFGTHARRRRLSTSADNAMRPTVPVALLAARRSARFGVAAAVLVCAAAMDTGCTAQAPQPVAGLTSTASSAPSSSEDPKSAEARRKALAAYQGYLLAYAAASQAADPDDPNLATYLADPLLSLTRHNIRALKRLGEVQMGAQTATVASSQVDLNETPPTVTIRACLDYSALTLVYQTSRSPVPDSALTTTRVPTVATVAKYPTGKWLVINTRKGSSAC